jgi:hypothetical protein
VPGRRRFRSTEPSVREENNEDSDEEPDCVNIDIAEATQDLNINFFNESHRIPNNMPLDRKIELAAKQKQMLGIQKEAYDIGQKKYEAEEYMRNKLLAKQRAKITEGEIVAKEVEQMMKEWQREDEG